MITIPTMMILKISDYYVWSELSSSSVKFFVICGSNAWTSVVFDENHSDFKPVSRKNQVWSEYFNSVRQSLSCVDSEQYDYIFKQDDMGLLFSVRQIVHNATDKIKIKLFECRLPAAESPQLIVDMFLSKSVSQQEEIYKLENMYNESISMIQVLRQDIESMSAWKDSLQDTMLQNFLVLLNSKKLRIVELETKLASIEQTIEQNKAAK
jgi:hypothetical protein